MPRELAAHDAVPEAALAWAEAGEGAALATVTETWGSAPRRPGALLAISGQAGLVGSVSGGCVESAVAAEALEALEDGRCRRLEFGVADEEAFAVGLACGGTIRVAVEPVGAGEGPPVELVRALAEARAARRAVVLATSEGWERQLLDGGEPGLGRQAREALRADRSGWVEAGDGARWFLAVHNPPLRMAIVGAAHIAQPLALMARATGFDVTVIDPRESFAADHRFPDAAITHDWPDEALRAHGLDARTALVCLSHDPKIDDPALREALGSGVFYVGALGSMRTAAKRRARLEEGGIEPALLDRIESPIGLDIGASGPAEIAVAIMAQIIERLRRPDTRPGG